MRRTGTYAIVLLSVAFLAAFLLWPLAHVFRKAFTDAGGFTLLYLRMVFTDTALAEALRTTTSIAVAVTCCAFLLALPLAQLMARHTFAGKTLLSGLLLVPLILPPFVGAVGLNIVFARTGALSTALMRLGVIDAPVDWLGAWPLAGVVLMEALHLFPILYLNLVASFANVDPNLEESAANLGATPWRVFTRVTMPLAAPGMFAGAILVFVWSFTELGTPLVFGIRQVLPVKIYDSVSEVGTNPGGYAMVVLVLAVAAAGFLASKFLLRRTDVATLGRMSVARTERRLPAWGAVLVWALAAGVLAVALIPHVSVLMVAFSRRWFLSVLPEDFTTVFFVRALSSDLTRSALLNSLALSAAATVVDILLGLGIAWVCVRGRIRGRTLLDAVAMMPLAIPGLVVAFGYIGCFSGAFPRTLLDPRTNPMILLAVSYAVRRLPFMLRAAYAGLEQTSRAYEDAAANLGAPPWRVLTRITVPLISANLIAGGVLCFVFSMMEVSDSMILAQAEEFYPVTKAIYALMDGLENGVRVASGLGVWAMALLGTALVWVSCLLGKRVGQMFRTS